MKATNSQLGAERRGEAATLTFEQHAVRARASARSFGLHDCMHYAPNAARRADALYAVANASGVKWWLGEGTIGLLPDGRMVLVSETAWFFEVQK